MRTFTGRSTFLYASTAFRIWPKPRRVKKWKI